MIPVKLSVEPQPISSRPFRGIGVQADAYLYDEQNRSMGVSDDDLRLYERRLAAVRPGIVRIFAPIDHFNASLDGETYDWSAPKARMLIDHLHNVKATGAKVNVCMGPWTNQQMIADGMERTGVDLVEHLVREEGLDNIEYLCLFNEPDGIYRHDSDTWRTIFGADRYDKAPDWSDYVAKNRRTQEMLEQRGLYPHVRLIVPDTVWGHPIRVERMHLAVRDFADLDVAYGYHVYQAEWPGFYDDDEQFRYPGMAAETRMFRELVGEKAELVVWEFNNAGVPFGSHFAGTGRFGEDLLGSLQSGVDITQKVLVGLREGLDGLCQWCLADMYYNCGPKIGPMRFGLWRYKWEHYKPRPYFYYYAALCRELRPGATLHRVECADPRLTAVAARGDGTLTAAVLNTSDDPMQVRLRLPDDAGPEPEAKRLRIYPQRLPTQDEMPAADWCEAPTADGAVDMDLLPAELTILRAK